MLPKYDVLSDRERSGGPVGLRVLNGKPTGIPLPLHPASPRLQTDSGDNEQREGEEQTQGGVAPSTIGCTSGVFTVMLLLPLAALSGYDGRPPVKLSPCRACPIAQR